MREFRDKAGNAWQIELNIGDVLRVKTASEGRFNLLDPDSKPGGECGERPLNSVVNCDETADFATLWELLFLLVEPTARERGIGAEDFAKTVPPDVLILAQQALIKEWSDFFQRLQRPDKAVLLEQMASLQAKAISKVKATIASPKMQEVESRIEAAMDASLNDSFGKLQETLDSILGPTQSANSS